MEKPHVSLKRGVSWSPGGGSKALHAAGGSHTSGSQTTAAWEKTEPNKEQMSRKTNLSRSASLSEKELTEARERSQIIAAQLTVPSNSRSRGVQLFNRRKQRVNAFTLESCGEGDGPENVNQASNKPTWAERSREDRDREQNYKNSPIKVPGRKPRNPIGDIMEEASHQCPKEDIVESNQVEKGFLPVVDREVEEASDEIESEFQETFASGTRIDPDVAKRSTREDEMSEGRVEPAKLSNGCHGNSGRGTVALSKQPVSIVNRTARPFFSPPTVQSQEPVSPVTEIPPPPSYSMPPLPAFTASPPVASSSPPPSPSYPTPSLPVFTNQPPQQYYTSPPPTSSAPESPRASQFEITLSSLPPMPHYGPPTAPKPSTFVPQPFGQRPTAPVKTGILEESAAKRSTKKSMFTFKEKPVVAPNPELLSLVQGVDERKKQSHHSVPDPSHEEELLALGAEASNFLNKEREKAEEAKAPEWASCLKSSRTRPRAEHKPEQTLSNVSGKGAELFAKRQSRMERYVVENPNAGLHNRSPSPTMSLPPSWVYPSNMPGRVKAIAKNSEMSAQLAQNIKSQQSTKQKPRQRAASQEPIQEPPPLENGCTKIEMDLSRHRPYQINSSLFILNPVKDPISTLPRGAPQAKNLMPAQTLPRQSSLPTNTLPLFRSQCMSPTRSNTCPSSQASEQQQPAKSAFSADRVRPPRSGVQVPRPTFSAKKAGIEAQTHPESLPDDIQTETPAARTPSLVRRFSSPGLASSTWSCSLKTNPSSNAGSRSVTSPVCSPWSPRSMSPVGSQKSTSTCRSSQAAMTSPPWGSRCQSPVNPASTTSFSSLWGPRCQSPAVNQHSHSSSFSPTSPTASPASPPWGTRCPPSTQGQNSQLSASTTKSPQNSAASPASPPWMSRCQSPMANQNSHTSPDISVSSLRRSQTPTAVSPLTPPWGSRSQSPALFHSSLSFPATKPLHTSASSSPAPRDCMSPGASSQDSKTSHRILAKNIINAAKRKNSPSPGALSSHSLPMSPVGNSPHGFDSHKPPMSPFPVRQLGAQSPTFTSPPPTPTQRLCSPVRLYNTRSLTDSDASVESEDSGLRSPGLHSYNTCPRGWGGSLRVKRSTISTDL
ncbi:synaptopodin isoform 1-T1 [Synchiropus picturatus]